MRAFSYYVTLFPSLDIISGYSLTHHVVSNNLYLLIMGRDVLKAPQHLLDYLFRVVLSVFVAILPILAAFVVANLVTVLKFVGLVTFMNYIFPVLLQLSSIHVCKKKFRSPQKDHLPNNNESKVETSSRELGWTWLKNWVVGGDRALYATPYSITLVSHPVFAGMAVLLGVLLLILTFASLFIHLNPITCSKPLND